MKNEVMLKHAIELLQNVNPEELEIVQIDNTKYDDGSVGFNVSLTYPAKETFNAVNFDVQKVGELVEPHVTAMQERKKRKMHDAQFLK
ncbi:hypothetical protein F3157_08070 [Virgibacillus dakarensis]|nr:hypothetical protein [Virgibacillus dakarensis]